MNPWNILIVDDRAQPNGYEEGRFEVYQRLQDESYDGRGFAVVCAANQDSARTLIKSQNFDFILLDVLLDQWGDNSDGDLFKDLFSLAAERAPVGLISGGWDQTSMHLVRSHLSLNPAIKLPLFFTFNDFKNRAFAALIIQIVSHIRQQRGTFNLGLQPGEGIRILHLSDLHFGANREIQSLATLADIGLFGDRIKAEWPETLMGTAGPHLIVVTGDIANTGHPDEYRQAYNWFQSLCKNLEWELPSPRILAVPGNHDFSVPLCAAKYIRLQPDGSLKLAAQCDGNDNITRYSFAPYQEFISSVSVASCSACDFSTSAWTEFGFAEYGIVLSGYNTSRKPRPDAWPSRWLDKDDVLQVRDSFKNFKKHKASSSLFHITLSHHSLIRGSGAREEIDNAEEIREQLFGSWCPPNLMLHGHEHKRFGELPSGNDFMVVTAPSPTVDTTHRPANTAQGVNLINLAREGGKITKVTVNSLIRLEDGWTIAKLPNKSSHSVVAAI